MSTPIVHLLPRPQRMVHLEGTFPLASNRFILIRDDPGLALFSARRLQTALAEGGIRWELTAFGEEDPRVGAALLIDPAQVARPQGYRLEISPNQIRVTGHDTAGLFYGVATLGQLLRQFPQALPCLRIDDWPDFPQRGVMLDISRNKVPTLETLYDLVDLLAGWKVNQLQLYMEHTFAYRDHEVVWANASPLTGDEVLALDAWCRQRCVELVPNQNSFGHFHRWLKHEKYRHLAEVPEGIDLWGLGDNEPFSLCPGDPGSLALLRDLYAELLPHFTSRQFNVGCDETFDLGKGRSRQACEERGTGRVYLDFLTEIHRLVRAHGRTMQFWGDIILHYPELIPALPPGVIALNWGYGANHPFATECARFAAAGVPFYVCPSTATWNSLVGRTDNARANLLNAAENGIAHGAIGYLNTDWGDNGHPQYLPVSFLGFAYGAGLSWALEANRDLDLPRVLDLFAFRDEAGVMGRLAYDLGNAYRVWGVGGVEGSISVPAVPLLFTNWAMQSEAQPERGPEGLRRAFNAVSADGLQRTVEYIEEVMAPLSQARMARPDAALIADEFRNGAAWLSHACRLRIAWLQAARLKEIPASVRAELAADLEGIIAEHRRLWLARNRPGGLAESVGKWLQPWLDFYRSR